MKKLLAMLLALTLLLGAAPFALAEETIVLDWWVTDVATLTDIYEKVAEAYEALNPNIDIRVSSYPSDYSEKVRAAQAAKQPPDIYIQEVLANAATSGLFLDLTPYMERDGFDPQEIYYQPYMDYMCKYEDKYYALPRDVFSLAIVYNKDIFDAAGIAYPEEGWTLDEFTEIARQLTDPDKRQFGVALPEIWSLFNMLWSFEGDMCNEDGTAGEGYINSEGTIAFFQYLQDLMYVDKAAPTPQQLESFDGAENIFMLGQLGMIAVERYAVGSFKEAEMNIGAVSMPIGPDGQEWTYASAPSWSISASCAHPDEAWEFLKFAFGYEGSKILGESRYFFPIVKGVPEELGFMDDPIEVTFMEQLDESRQTKIAFWWRRPADWTGVWAPPILDSWEYAWDEILLNQADVRETLDAAAAEMDQGIQDYIRQTGN